jgi:hypothetical protein
MINYLENGTLPKLQKEARRLLIKVPEYCIMDQLLFHSRLALSAMVSLIVEMLSFPL